MTLEEYIEERRKRVANMTLAQARDLIAETLSHSDMELEFDKAVWMLLNCADEKINNGWIPTSVRYPKSEDEYKYFLVTDDKGKVSVQEFYLSLDEEPQPYFSGMGNIVAWMPLPQPYKAESEG